MKKAPFDRNTECSAREVLIDECRLCFATAAGCTVVGLLATSYHRWCGQTSPLAALLVVGGFYGVMGVGRLVKYLQTPAGVQSRIESGH